MIIDCTMFFNEFDILEGRLKYLNDVVDYFVIVESDTTFNGNDKPFNFAQNISRYAPYLHKILYFPMHVDKSLYDFTVKTDVLDFSTPQWKIENDQRNYMLKALSLFPDEAVVLISDVDEIPSKTAIEFSVNNLTEKRTSLSLQQDMFYYNFNQRQVSKWCGTVVTHNKFARELTPQYFRDSRFNLPRVSDGGWHMSYFTTPDGISYKIENFSHQEYNKDVYRDVDRIKKCIDAGSDLFDREHNTFEAFDKTSLPSDMINIFGAYESVN